MDQPAPPPAAIVVDADVRSHAKERLYVLCQTGGWLTLTVLQIVFMRVVRGSDKFAETSLAIVQTLFLGWLLTHYARRWMTRWGWKELSWRPLLPRVLGMALAISIVWSAVGYGYYYGLLRQPYPENIHPVLLFAVSLLNGTLVMVGWLCVYFFYHLFDRYNRLKIEQLRLSAAVKEAELRALKSQINPHFIFNSLNSLRALIDENPARARQAVTQLANLLRYSLHSGQLETVPFEDELCTVNDYLALEQVRHEERLRVRIDVAPETLAQPLPPMLLQTLVENAIKYGIAPRREGGEVAVVARCEGDRLRLQVINPGVLAAAGGSTGVGLRNAAERLRLLFGERATLTLREDPPGRVVAEVVMPGAVLAHPAGPVPSASRRENPRVPAAQSA